MLRKILRDWPLAGLAAVPIMVWWLGWYPGFASSDSIDQFGQIQSGVIFNYHPAIHTLYMGLFSGGGGLPGLVTLFQLIAFGALMAYAAYWLIAAGVPKWLAIGGAWLLGLSPAVAPTTITLWKDIPFGLFFLWAWIELLAMSVDQKRADRRWPLIRLGLAVAGIWLFRGNGPITVMLTVAALSWVYRRHLRSLLAATATAAAAVILVSGPLYAAFEVRGSAVEPATVFLPDIAGSYNSEPETFSADDVGLLTALAPIGVWTSRYTCFDSTPLLFDPRFDADPVRTDPGEYRSLELRVLWRDPDSVIKHRLCASNFLYSPPQPDDAYFHRPEYSIPANDVGLARDAVSDRAFAVTDRIWRWAEPNEVLWLTWRPALVVLASLVVIGAFIAVPTGRRFLVPAALFVAHLVNVAGTSPAQEFRFAYPLYLTGVLTVMLAWPVVLRRRAG